MSEPLAEVAFQDDGQKTVQFANPLVPRFTNRSVSGTRMFSKFRLVAVGFALFALSCCHAMACANLSQTRSIFYQYEDLPTAPDADVIAEVTILAEGATDDGAEFGLARVDRVIKGSVGNTLRIITFISDCQNMFSVGDHGIVIGNLRKNRQGEVELVAKSESRFTKMRRRQTGIDIK